MQTSTKLIRDAFSPAQRRVIDKLTTPQKVQDYLDTLKNKFKQQGDIIINAPVWVMKTKQASCIEGALLAAASLAYHGREPLLMDFQTTPQDDDHVIALFKDKGYWGAISKTNHPMLRWRDPVYKTPRELAMSYFHEYYLPDRGKHYAHKTMRAYSAPFNLRRFQPESWIRSDGDLDWLALELDESRHFKVVPRGAQLRNASPIELKSMKLCEWPKR